MTENVIDITPEENTEIEIIEEVLKEEREEEIKAEEILEPELELEKEEESSIENSEEEHSNKIDEIEDKPISKEIEQEIEEDDNLDEVDENVSDEKEIVTSENKNAEEVSEIEKEVLSEEIEENIVNEEPVKEIRENETIYINAEDTEVLDNALEIRFTSFKANNLPIEFSTIRNLDEATFVKSFGVTDIKNGEFLIKDCQGKLIDISGRKFFEFKNREFKLGLEIIWNPNGTFSCTENNFYYKITTINIKRFLFNLKFLKSVFSGESIELNGKILSGKINCLNRIEILKFDLLVSLFNKLEILNKEKLLQEGNTLYALTLLTELEEGRNEVNTWINSRMKKGDIISGDNLVITRVHKINGESFDIKETIYLNTPIDEKEIKDENIALYRKTCRVHLEKINKR